MSNQYLLDFFQYIHDGSETTSDDFVVVGHAGEKESEPSSVFISISPINDMPPIVVNRSDIKIWRGGVVVISPSDLGMLYYYFSRSVKTMLLKDVSTIKIFKPK